MIQIFNLACAVFMLMFVEVVFINGILSSETMTERGVAMVLSIITAFGLAGVFDALRVVL